MTMLSICLFAIMICSVLSESINCQLKPGCDINHCDPSPSSWNKPGFNIDEYLQKKQFPITCEAQKKKSSDDVLRLYADNAENRQEIKDLKQDVRNLVQKVSVSEKKNNNAENGAVTDIQNMVKKVSALEQKNKNAENDVRNLVKKVLVLEEKNNNAEIEIKKLQKKVDMMGATGRTTGEPVTTRGVVTTSETTTPGTNADSLWFDGKRYIALLSEEVNKATAEAKCHTIGGNLANVYSRTHLKKIMDYVHQNKMDGLSWKKIHLGMTYDPINRILRWRDGTQVSISDYKWMPGYPYNGVYYASWTNMFIQIQSTPSVVNHYLINFRDSNHFTLCEI